MPEKKELENILEKCNVSLIIRELFAGEYIFPGPYSSHTITFSCGTCPFCGEEELFSKEESPYYICYNCGMSGDVVSLLIDGKAWGYEETIDYLGKRFGFEIRRTTKAWERNNAF